MGKVSRYYGKDRGSFGDIIHSKETDEFFAKLSLGALGKIDLLLQKREDGFYNVLKVYYKDGEKKTFSLGQTFPVKNKDKIIVQGLSQFALSLFNEYDKEKEKDLMRNEDCLILTTHKLKEQVKINDKLTKVGYITGKFAIEKDESANNTENEKDQDEIPF